MPPKPGDASAVFSNPDRGVAIAKLRTAADSIAI